MGARQAVPLTPSESLSFAKLLSGQQLSRLTSLAATLVDSAVSVANKRLTARLTPLDAAHTKNPGGGVPVMVNHPSLQSNSLRLSLCPAVLPCCYTQLERPQGAYLCLKPPRQQPPYRLAPSRTPWARSKFPPTATTARRPPARSSTSPSARTSCHPSSFARSASSKKPPRSSIWTSQSSRTKSAASSPAPPTKLSKENSTTTSLSASGKPAAARKPT